MMMTMTQLTRVASADVALDHLAGFAAMLRRIGAIVLPASHQMSIDTEAHGGERGRLLTAGTWAYAPAIAEKTCVNPAFVTNAFTAKDHSQRTRPT